MFMPWKTSHICPGLLGDNETVGLLSSFRDVIRTFSIMLWFAKTKQFVLNIWNQQHAKDGTEISQDAVHFQGDPFVKEDKSGVK